MRPSPGSSTGEIQCTSESLNEQVWKRVGGMAAKDLLSKFDIQEKGLEGFVKAMRYFPWCILVGYQIRENQDQKAISTFLEFGDCAPNSESTISTQL